MQKHRRTQIHRRLRCSGTNRLLISDFGSSTRGERDTIRKSLSYHTMLTTPQRSAHLVIQSQFLHTMVGPQLLNTMAGTQLNLFSKYSKFSAHLFWASTLQFISCLGFIMTMVIVISFVRERKLHQLTTHLNS